MHVDDSSNVQSRLSSYEVAALKSLALYIAATMQSHLWLRGAEEFQGVL